MTCNDEFDQILDDALAEYREAEPLAGLEDRVLLRVTSQAERRLRPWLRWSAIAAAAAVLAIAAWIGLSARHEALPSPAAQKQALPAKTRPQNTEARAPNVPAPNPVQAAKTIRPRSDRVPVATQVATAEPAPQFPTPAPLKAEERVLLALAQTNPEMLRELARSADDEEISIAPITIKPLVDETAGAQGEN